MRLRIEHWQLILDICEKNHELFTNKFNGPDGKAKGHALWQNFTHKINSLGFGEKTTEEWRKASVNWKSKTKAKAAKIKKEIGKTGGGPANYIPLSDLENRLIEIMGKKAINGDEVRELGCGKIKLVTVNSVTSKGKSNDNLLIQEQLIIELGRQELIGFFKNSIILMRSINNF